MVENMKRRFWFLSRLIEVVVLFACAIQMSGCAAGYQKMSMWDGMGYRDQQVGEGRYRISYTVNALTTAEQTRSYWMRRASELCGHDNFYYDLSVTTRTSSDVMFVGGVVYTPSSDRPYAEGFVDCNRPQEKR